MKRFIIINGVMGVGKTTTGKLLSDKLSRTAFIDGDWCIDIHPFVGNKETKEMAIDNIVHLTKNYYKCTESDNIVLSWIMSQNSIDKILHGLDGLNLQIYSITLICNEESLTDRWNKDKTTEWRTEELLESNIKSIDNFNNRDCTIKIDTSNITADEAVNKIIEIIKCNERL